MRALLDVNVLIALLDASHIHHGQAHDWLAENIEAGWASCPITENGCVRILGQSNYPNPVPLRDAVARLREAQATPWHAFWADSISLVGADRIDFDYVHGSRQLTDVFLLALAAENNGRFVTFDRRLSLKAARRATSENLIQL